MRITNKCTWLKITGAALGLLGTLTLSSCKSFLDDGYTISGTVVGRDPVTNEYVPVKNIAVTLCDYADSERIKEQTSTDMFGAFHIYDLYKGTYSLVLTDIDGDENGAYKQEKIIIPLGGSVDFEIKLRKD